MRVKDLNTSGDVPFAKPKPGKNTTTLKPIKRTIPKPPPAAKKGK